MPKPQGHPFTPMPDLHSASGIWPPLTNFSATFLVQDTITSSLARSMQSPLYWSPCVMVNFMCLLDWAGGPRYLFKHFSGFVCDSVSGWDLCLNHRLNTAHFPPQCGVGLIQYTGSQNRTKKAEQGRIRALCLTATKQVIGLLLTVDLDLGPPAWDCRLGASQLP